MQVMSRVRFVGIGRVLVIAVSTFADAAFVFWGAGIAGVEEGLFGKGTGGATDEGLSSGAADLTLIPFT